jgi:hypothetical protein
VGDRYPRARPGKRALGKWVLGLSIALALVRLGAADAESAVPVRFTDTVPPIGGKNLVPNSSFEVGDAGWSSLGAEGAGYKNGWAPLFGNWGNLGTLHGTVERGGAAEGGAFLRIHVGAEDTPVFNYDYFVPVNHRELRPLAASRGWIEVTPGKPYTVSVSLRGSKAGVPAAFGVHEEDPATAWSGSADDNLKQVSVGTRWKRYQYTFTPKYPFLFVLAGPSLTREETVAVDVDAVQLEEGSQATPYAPRGTLEVGIEPSATEGVFTIGEPASLTIRAFNASAQGVHTAVSFAVTDFDDHPVSIPDARLDVPAGAPAEARVALPADWKGFYRIRAAFGAGSARETRLIRIAFVPARGSADSVIGVNHAFPTRFHVQMARMAGVTWYRDWSLKWQHVEPQEGHFRWDVSDPEIRRVPEQGAHLMAMIPFPSAEWNSTGPSLAVLQSLIRSYREGGLGDSGELIPRARWAWPPRDPAELGRFAQTVVQRYRKEVQVWEFLNEPLFTDYALPDAEHFEIDPGPGAPPQAEIDRLKSTLLKGYTFADYLALLRSVSPYIRAGNPKARIMGGPGFPGDGKYTLAMVRGGILGSIDILGIHDYPFMSAPEKLLHRMDTLQAAMRENGGPKPVWLTEFSYFGTDDLAREPFVPTPGVFSEKQLLSERQVAENIVRFCTIFLSRGGEKIFLHSGSVGSVNNPGTESCLFADGGVCKVFPALAVFTNEIGPAPKAAGDRENGTRFAFAFESGAQSTDVLWDTAGTSEVAIPAGATCRDIVGRTLAGPSVRLSGSPVYLVAAPGRAAEILAASEAGPRG